MRWKSLWSGPTLSDRVETKDYAVNYSCTWGSVGLWALDYEDQAWTYCFHVYDARGKWIRFDDLMSGEAARRDQREQAILRGETP